MVRLLVVLAALAGCRAKPAVPAPDVAPVEAAPVPPPMELLWTTPSWDKKATLEARKTGKCRIVCSLGETEVWSTDGCSIEAREFRFVSGDCKTAIVLFPQPVRASTFANLALVRVYRDGKPAEELTDVDLEVDSKASRFRWLGGAVGEFGEKPRYLPDGSGVEFQLITAAGRVTKRLPLDGAKVTATWDGGAAAPPPNSR